MKKLEKELLTALEDATTISRNRKLKVEGFKDANKAFYVEFADKDEKIQYNLYWGNEKVVTISGEFYMTLAASIFKNFIEF